MGHLLAATAAAFLFVILQLQQLLSMVIDPHNSGQQLLQCQLPGCLMRLRYQLAMASAG